MAKPIRDIWQALSPAGEKSSAAGDVERPGEPDQGRMRWNLPSDSNADPRGSVSSDENGDLLAAFAGMNEAEDADTGFSLDMDRYIRGIWSRRWIVLLCAALVTAALGAFAFFMFDRSWVAHATLVKRAYQDEFQVGRFGKPFKPQSYNLKTLLDTLLLPSVLDEAANRAGVSVGARSFARRINIRKDKESQIFDITVRWDDPAIAAALTNRLAEVFIERNRSIRRSDAEETLLYYQGRQQSAERQSEAINSELQGFQDQYAISDIDTQLEVLVMELQRVTIDGQALDAEVAATSQDLKRLAEAINTEPEMIVQSSYFQNPLQSNRSELIWQLEQARSRYTAQNPKVIDLQDRIAKIDTLIKGGGDDSSKSNTFANNPVRQDLAITRYQVQRQYNQALARQQALKNSRESMTKRLETLSSKQKEYDQLKVKHEAALQLQRNLNHRVEEARVIMMRNEADFELIERARPPVEGESSGRKLLVVAGAVIGTALGLCLALLLEFLDNRLRTLRDLRRLAPDLFVAEIQHVGEAEEVVVDANLPSDRVAIAFRRLMNDMESHHKERLPSIGVTSLGRGAGRSLMATNIAQVLGLKERRVILVDADVSPEAGERPGMLFEVAPTQGLDNVLDEEVSFLEALNDTESDNIKLITASRDTSPATSNYLAQLGGHIMCEGLDELRDNAEQLIVDLPPFDAHETVYEAAVHVGATVLVVPSGDVDRDELVEVLGRLEALEVDVLGLILNRVPFELTETTPLFEPSRRLTWSSRIAQRFARSESPLEVADS